MEILKLDRDLRLDNKNKEIVICCPVGDSKMFDNFAKMINKLGISKAKNIDFLFVAPPGLKYSSAKSTLSAIYYQENKVKLGTSGAFFACQVAAYQLNYKIIIMADIDVQMDDPEVLYDCIQLARNQNKIVMPQCKARTTSDDTTSSSVWGFGVFPRSALEKFGMCNPFTYRGGEDWDYNMRTLEDKLEYRGGFIYHPHTGFTIFHKMEHPKKFYIYLNSLCKEFLLQKKWIHYFAWYCHFFWWADLLDDNQLKQIMRDSNCMEKLPNNLSDENPYIVIEKIKEQGKRYSKKESMIATYGALVQFIQGKPCEIYTDRIWLGIDGLDLLYRMLKATISAPFRAIDGIYNIIEWITKNRKTVVYPIMTNEDIKKSEAWMLLYFPKY